MKNKLLCVYLSLALSLTVPVQAFAEEVEPVPAPDDPAITEGVPDYSNHSDFEEVPDENGSFAIDDSSDGMLSPDTDGPSDEETLSDEEILPDAEVPSEEEAPSDGEILPDAEAPSDEEAPSEEETLSDEEVPSEEDAPSRLPWPDMDMPSGEDDEIPFDTENPSESEDDMLTDWEEPPVEEELPNDKEEVVPEVDEIPAEEDLPAAPATIKVIVPDTGRVVVNPYKLEVSTGHGVSHEQIVHEAQPLTNLSDVPVMVNAWAMGTIPDGSEACFVSAPPAAKEPEKAVFMYAEFQNYPAIWSGEYTGDVHQVIVLETGNGGEAVLKLEPWEEGYFRLFGTASAAPAAMWEEWDTVDVTVAFTFVPVNTVEDADGDGNRDIPNGTTAADPEEDPLDASETQDFPDSSDILV